MNPPPRGGTKTPKLSLCLGWAGSESIADSAGPERQMGQPGPHQKARECAPYKPWSRSASRLWRRPVSGVRAARATPRACRRSRSRCSRARDRGVEHLAAQEERAGGRVRDDHRHRELDPLAAVDRAGVGEPEAIGLLGRQPEDGSSARSSSSAAVVVRPHSLVGRRTSSSSRSSVPFISPSSWRLRPVIISLSPIRSRPPRTGSPVGVERVPQRRVERVDPELPAVDGREHLDVADRIDVVVVGQALADERDDLLARGARGRRARS